MPCHPIRGGNGQTIGFVCTRGRRKKCQWCDGPGAFQCDAPSERASRTCDAIFCGHHKTTIDGKDYCPNCAGRMRETIAHTTQKEK